MAQRRLPFLRILAEAYRCSVQAAGAAPLSLAAAGLLVIAEDVTQQAAGLTAKDPMSAFSDPVLAGLFLWKEVGIWLITLLAFRLVLSGDRGVRLWRIDRWALAIFALMLADLILANWEAYAAAQTAALLAVDLNHWAVTAVKLSTVLLLGVAELRLFELIQPAWATGDGSAGFGAGWRRMRGNTWLVWLATVLCPLPIMVGHYALGYAFRGGGGEPLQLAAMAFDGLIETVIVLLSTALNAVVFDRLAGRRAVPEVASPAPVRAGVPSPAGV
jgi:hypothetical protein